MPSNIEIKAKLPCGIKAAEEVAKSLGATGPEILSQRDVFFQVPHGRMKLRTEGNRSVLITYFRTDASGPKQSKYTLVPIEHPDLLEEALGAALGIRGVVKKERTLYLLQWSKEPRLTARIHLDKVEGLGELLEFEVVLPSDPDEKYSVLGQEFANELMDSFKIQEHDLIEGAYLDMILAS